eukprot:909711-Alexandrium_andersonii.AAC.1
MRSTHDEPKPPKTTDDTNGSTIDDKDEPPDSKRTDDKNEATSDEEKKKTKLQNRPLLRRSPGL